MKITARIAVAIVFGLCGAALAPAQRPASAAQGGAEAYNTPGTADNLQIARIWGDEKGETHFELIDLLPGGRPAVKGGVFTTYPPKVEGPGPLAGLARVGLPIRGNLGFTMIAGDTVVPAIHALARSYFLTLSGPGFEWKATDGTAMHARPGGAIFLADEQGSKGHITRALGLDSVFMSIPVMGDSPKRPCAKAANVLDCLMGK